MKKIALIWVAVLCGAIVASCQNNAQQPIHVSGIYPHLAMYNDEGECGTGSVVEWGDKLWVITYGPHLPKGSSDKLYQITPSMQQIVRPESIGGTPANRMVHKESDQLFIGPYAINKQGDVRTIPYTMMPGRHTGNARHLTDPAGKIYYATMEEGFYEVDVNTLEVNTLYVDKNIDKKVQTLPGDHGKGVYSGQGVMVYSNNGELSREAMTDFDATSGVLAEWDGKDWKVIRRNQFVEVTGPGGIYGNANPATDPIWATGWDHKSILLGVRDNGAWSFYRLPKASHSYDGAHGWNTEWPRIRNVGTAERPDYLMTMHGMFWRFPATFTSRATAGVRPRSAYLKVIGDYTRWNNQLVFGCDDAAQKEFLNKRKAKGVLEGAGQSNSNLWFTSIDTPDSLGVTTANGAVWIDEEVVAKQASEPFLFAGWDNRSAWVMNSSNNAVVYTFEVDAVGNNQWKKIQEVTVLPHTAANVVFTEKGEWVRVSTDKNVKTSVSFNYTQNDQRTTVADQMFAGLTKISDKNSIDGLLYGLGDNRRTMGVLNQAGYYELDEKMVLTRKDDPQTVAYMQEKFTIPCDVVAVEAGSVLIVDEKGRRWRLPLGDEQFTQELKNGTMRICREVATERDLFNCHGTFYELPAENADGYAKIRPIASHNLKINDYSSYRGLLVMTGIAPELAQENPHVFVSHDKKAAVWAGAIDDLWKLGKPVGKGGPWVNTQTQKGVPSDPYLIGFYNSRSMTLSHNAPQSITFTLEVDPVGNGSWMPYASYKVEAGQKLSQTLPESFSARWVRFKTDAPTVATTWLEYK